MKHNIESTLQTAFNPTHLSIIDESHLHAGHNENAMHGNTHFRIEIHSPKFQNKSRIAMHRMVNTALSDYFEQGLHALALVTKPSKLPS